MFEKFGEFDSAEELNRAAAAQKAEGDEEAIFALAQENGIDKEDAQDYLDGLMPALTNPLTAAIGKLQEEEKELELGGILTDWKEQIIAACMDDIEMRAAVRRKGKRLAECMAQLLRFAFENKVQVSEKIVKITKVTHNGREEPMRGPIYLGVPNRAQAEQIIRTYYLEKGAGT